MWLVVSAPDFSVLFWASLYFSQKFPSLVVQVDLETQNLEGFSLRPPAFLVLDWM